MTAGLPPFVHDLLDRRIDPLADPAARAWLLAHPEALEHFAALRRTLSALPRTLPAPPVPTPRAKHRRRWPWPLASAAAVAAAVILGLRTPAAPEPPPLPQPELVAGAVVTWSATTHEVRGGRSLQFTLLDRAQIRCERVVCAPTEQVRYVAARTTERQLIAP